MKELLKKIINNDIFRRAVKTFMQAFLGSFMLSMNNLSSIDENVLKSALIGAISSGICAVMNYTLQIIKKWR